MRLSQDLFFGLARGEAYNPCWIWLELKPKKQSSSESSDDSDASLLP